MATDKAYVRYSVVCNGKIYDYPLHANKRRFIRNIADVVNILEYCVTRELRDELQKHDVYKPQENKYNWTVVRYINDKKDPIGSNRLMLTITPLVERMIEDTILRSRGLPVDGIN